MSKTKGKFKAFLNKFPKWNTPLPGHYLSLKEWIVYCIGGAGAYGATMFISLVTLQHGVYIAGALSMNVDHVTLVGIITSIIVVITSPLVSYLIDNTQSKYGKFRPYLIWLPIPMVLCFFALGQLAAHIPDNYVLNLVLFTILFNIINFLNRLYTLAFNSIVQVISPSVNERTSIMSIGTFFTSLGPTLVSMIFPIVANYIYTTDDAAGVLQIDSFKYIVPIMALVFFAIGLWFAFSVKERIVVPKSYKQKVKFTSGVKKTFENKYFWIFNVSNILGSFRLLATTFTLLIINYMVFPQLDASGHENMRNLAQTIITTLVGDACVPGMLLAPIFIKKFGKRNLTIFANLMTALSTIPMIFIKNPYVLLVFIYLVTFFNGLNIVLQPALQAEIYDYQQYKTGDRLEGFLSQFGVMMLTFVGIGIAFVNPAIYKHFGWIDDIKVLYNPDVFLPIIRTMCGLAAGSGILSIIPYFFYDLNAKKHEQIMNVLKVRACCEDGTCDSETALSVENSILNGDSDCFLEFSNTYLQETPSEDTLDLEDKTIEDSTNEDPLNKDNETK